MLEVTNLYTNNAASDCQQAAKFQLNPSTQTVRVVKQVLWGHPQTKSVQLYMYYANLCQSPQQFL